MKNAVIKICTKDTHNWREPSLAECVILKIGERENEKTVVVPCAGPAWLIKKSENMCSENIFLCDIKC